MNATTPQHSYLAAVDSKFWLIFGLSLALHAAILLWSRGPQHATLPVMPTILASLRLAVAPPSPPTEASTVRTTPPVPAVRPPPTPPRPARREQIATHKPMPTTTPSAAVNQPAEPAAPPTPNTTVAAVANIAPAPPSVTATPPVVAPARPQSSLLAAYRQRLTDILAGQQQYPRVAALRGWEGEVQLRLRVARKGNLLAVQLDRSSGFNVLDQHALAMIEQLASLPPLPEGLEANEIQVIVPISYKLKKTT